MRQRRIWRRTAIAWMGTAIVALGAATCASALQNPSLDNAGFIYGQITTRSGTEYKGFLRWGKEEGFWDDLFHSGKEDLPYLEEFEDDRRRGRRRDHRHRIEIFNWGIEWGGSQRHGSASRIFISRFGDIDEIVVTGDKAADVLMKSGETYEVRGYSNDVGGTVHVNDASLGEIDLRWDRIETIRFMPAPRGEDPGAYRLRGKVETDSGDFEGFIQWDKEECMNTDLLNGEAEDGKMAIEMGRIRSIERRSRRAAIVELKDGRTIELRGSNDVNNENRGIMVEDPRYGRLTVPWDEFEKLTLSDPRDSGRGYEKFGRSGSLQGTVTDLDGAEYHGRLVIDLDESETWEILNGSYRDIKFDIPLSDVRSIEPLGLDESLVVLHNGQELELEDGQDVTERNDGVLIFDSPDADPVYLRWDEVRRVRFDR